MKRVDTLPFVNKELVEYWGTIFNKISNKMKVVVKRNQGKIPYTTNNEAYYDNRMDLTKYSIKDGPCWWTNGFWPGILWQLYNYTDDDFFKSEALKAEEMMDECFNLFEGLNHDVGFMWLPSSGINYKKFRNEKSKVRILHAATILAGRFNPVAQFIKAWDTFRGEDVSGIAVIDSLMNLSLLFDAYKITKDVRFKFIATAHADKLLEAYRYDDGSFAHMVKFNPETGSKEETISGQGYSNTSAWSRGQGWALYGYTNCYINTRDLKYLEAAKGVANFILANLNDDGSIPIDFKQPSDTNYNDTCAAAIIASALIELSCVVDETDARLYFNAALVILNNLNSNYANYDANVDYILSNATTAWRTKDKPTTMVYADYFYIEAVLKLIGKSLNLWNNF